ncbi:MAG: tagaturonate reductase [Flavobacteriaceae bacterium]
MVTLNRKTIAIHPVLPLKVMQFGGGNFIRCFVDWMVQILNEQADFNAGVVFIKPTSKGDYHRLDSQDGLFTVVLNGNDNGTLVTKTKLVSCVQQVLNPYTDWDAYLDLAKNPDIQFIVSNTTEAGIKFNPDDQFAESPPKEFPAKLTVWLYHRFQHFGNDLDKGCVMMPGELIEDNGDALKTAILNYSKAWRLGDGFMAWVNNANHFCNTLVDRIVSGYPTGNANQLQHQLGYIDELMVVGEQYHSWVIEAPNTVRRLLPFHRTDLKVAFVDDIGPFREMKVRLLNGAHTAMVPIAYLSGMVFVNETMEHPLLSAFIESCLKDEVNPTLPFPENHKQAYINDVLDRFRNPALKHRLIDISLNSTSKFVTRLLPTLKDFYSREGQLPKNIVFAFSALIQFYEGEFNGEKIDLKDDARSLDFFKGNWIKLNSGSLSLDQMVHIVLGNVSIWESDLTQFRGLSDAVSAHLTAIKKYGMLEALSRLIENKKPANNS